ncbi:Tripartite motif-containing protein 16 [Labeo rohita]|uniref:Tripartite motif-containing protein 16 n=1 Tax=Labeo rohita TaxID=84645 RepID=A0ABQ8L2X3_LABRO|nr:Tripartite motif-containing protein 16 [Labeo rohita]
MGTSQISPQDACFLTLDPNTANTELSLSEENRTVTNKDKKHSYPDHRDRFDYYYQVLCRESVCGRCYWEIEWSGNEGVYISVSYKSIRRKGRGNECAFGNNDQSWSLFCSPDRYSFKHNNIETDLPVKPIISRIGVYVDESAGTLSFYSVSDTMSLIHTVQITFTQTLCAGFRGTSVTIRNRDVPYLSYTLSCVQCTTLGHKSGRVTNDRAQIRIFLQKRQVAQMNLEKRKSRRFVYGDVGGYVWRAPSRGDYTMKAKASRGRDLIKNNEADGRD